MIPIPSLSVGAWLKLGAAAAVVGGVLWFRYDYVRRGDQIDELSAEVDQYRSAVESYRTANEAWADAARQREEVMRRERERRARQQALAQDELDAAQAAAADAERRSRQWRDRFTNRPQGCAAALAALDSACPSLRGY